MRIETAVMIDLIVQRDYDDSDQLYNDLEELVSESIRLENEYVSKSEQRSEAIPHDTVVSLRLTLEKEIESFEEARKIAKGKYREAELIYEGIIKGIKNAVNHIIQIEHPTS
jgi:hypothetical protein